MSLRDVILHNFWLKLFSVALATVIWLAIHYSIHNEPLKNQLLTDDYIRVPVTVQTAPGDKRSFRVTPKEVVVHAVGRDATSLHASSKDIRVNLNLTGFAGNESRMETLKAVAPLGINVLEIMPAVVEVRQESP